MIFLTKAWKPQAVCTLKAKRGNCMKKIIPILLPGLFSAAEILAALYLKRQIPAGSAGLSMAADLLLYAWIAYNGCSWTIGYKKIFIHGIWFFQEADVLLTRTAKKPSSACASRRPPSVRSFFSGSCFLYIPFWRYCRREKCS